MNQPDDLGYRFCVIALQNLMVLYLIGQVGQVQGPELDSLPGHNLK